MRKTLILMLIIAVVVVTALIELLPYGLPSSTAKENILLECSAGNDCYSSCSGCVSTASVVSNSDCPLSESLCKCVKSSCQYILSSDQALDIVNENTPLRQEGDEISNISLVNDSEGNLFWKAESSSGASITVDASSGEIVEDCGSGECNECEYSDVEDTLEGQVLYQNIGCSNPLPTCGENNTCGACQSDADCVSKKVTSTLYLDIGDLVDGYEYSILSTGINGTYNDLEGICMIYDNGIEIYSNTTTDTECGDIILSHALCNVTCSAR
jgi:hypothetical protein